jgi:hypothetical protein
MDQDRVPCVQCKCLGKTKSGHRCPGCQGTGFAITQKQEDYCSKLLESNPRLRKEVDGNARLRAYAFGEPRRPRAGRKPRARGRANTAPLAANSPPASVPPRYSEPPVWAKEAAAKSSRARRAPGSGVEPARKKQRTAPLMLAGGTRTPNTGHLRPNERTRVTSDPTAYRRHLETVSEHHETVEDDPGLAWLPY